MAAQLRITVPLLSLAGLAASCGGGGGGGAAPVPPTLVFATPQFTTTSGANSRATIVADVDHNGIADVMVANETSASVSVLSGAADGSLVAGVSLTAPTLVAGLAVGDVDGDRWLDVVATSGVGIEAMLLRSTGGGAFAPPAPFGMPWPARKIGLVDWTGDGNLDLVAASSTTAEVALLAGDGLGGFGVPVVAATSTVVADFAIVDTQRDGRPDLVCIGEGALRLDTLRNNGTAGFLPVVFSAAPALGTRLVACDLDRNLVTDLVALDQAGSTAMVFLGDGAGGYTLTGGRSLAAGRVGSLALTDLDADGKTDLVATAGNRLVVAYGDGAGGLQPVQTLFVDAAGASWVAATDLLGDGSVDLVYVSGSNRTGILRNPKGSPVGVVPYGDGSPDCRGRIGMSANGSPRLGNVDYGYRVTNAPANAVGVLVQGGPPNITGGDPFGLGVRLHLGIGLATTRLAFSNQVGECFLPEPVPSDPGFVGLPVYVQTLWQADLANTCAPSPVGYVSSTGLTSTVQP